MMFTCFYGCNHYCGDKKIDGEVLECEDIYEIETKNMIFVKFQFV